MVSADVARGDGKDYSTFHIFKIETMEVVGEYQGKLTPDMFARMLLDVGKQYGNCMLLWKIIPSVGQFLINYKNRHIQIYSILISHLTIM